jgi:hypothetical protein
LRLQLTALWPIVVTRLPASVLDANQITIDRRRIVALLGALFGFTYFRHRSAYLLVATPPRTPRRRKPGDPWPRSTPILPSPFTPDEIKERTTFELANEVTC